jgi:hypothetical protein
LKPKIQLIPIQVRKQLIIKKFKKEKERKLNQKKKIESIINKSKM